MIVTKSGLLSIILSVQQFLASNLVTANVEVGWKRRRRQTNQVAGAANRIVFTPSGDERGSGGNLVRPMMPGYRDTQETGTTIRPLLDWQRKILISVWAVDESNKQSEAAQIEATETLFEWVVRAVHGAQGGFAALTWGEVTWTIPQENAFGLELQASVVLQHPIFDQPSELVFPDAFRPTINAATLPEVLPELDAVYPTSFSPGSGIVPILLGGSGFSKYGTVRVDGVVVDSVYVDQNDIIAYVDLGALALGSHIVTFTDSNGNSTLPGSFSVSSGGSNPAPSLTSISVTSAVATAGDVANVATGTSFSNGSLVYIDGEPVPTTYVNSTTLNFTVPDWIVEVPGDHSVIVVTGPPGGGSSLAVTFSSTYPVSTLQLLSVTNGPIGVTLVTRVLADYVYPATTGRVDGASATASYVDPRRIDVTLSAGIMAVPGPHTVAIRNPAPGGGNSGTLTVDANLPVPTLSLGSTSTNQGSGNQVVAVTGTGFYSGYTTFQCDGVTISSTINSTTSATITIPSTVTNAVGDKLITAVNSIPGGGTSLPATYTVNRNAPTITSLSVTSATKNAGPVATLVNGTNFYANSVVRVDGVDITTTFISTTQLSVSIPASVTSVVGTKAIRVFNTTPGGGLSSSSPFVVNYTLLCDVPARIYDGGDWLLSGSNITQWNDSSGNGAHATQATPTAQPVTSTLVGPSATHASAKFSGTKGMSVAVPFPSGPKTIVTVRKFNVIPTTGVTVSLLTLKTGGRCFSELMFCNTVSTFQARTYLCDFAGGSSLASSGDSSTLDTNRHVDVIMQDGSDPTTQAGYDASFDGASSTEVASGNVSRLATDLQSIGSQLSSTNTVVRGANIDISLIIAFSRKLTTTELSDLQTYIAANY